jgi:hypothetical protein
MSLQRVTKRKLSCTAKSCLELCRNPNATPEQLAELLNGDDDVITTDFTTGENALMAACARDSFEMVDMLIDYDQNSLYQMALVTNQLAIHVAAQYASEDVMKRLVRNAPIQFIYLRDSNRQTPIMLCCSRADDKAPGVARVLLEVDSSADKGLFQDGRDGDDCTFKLAARYGTATLMRTLLAHISVPDFDESEENDTRDIMDGAVTNLQHGIEIARLLVTELGIPVTEYHIKTAIGSNRKQLFGFISLLPQPQPQHLTLTLEEIVRNVRYDRDPIGCVRLACLAAGHLKLDSKFFRKELHYNCNPTHLWASIRMGRLSLDDVLEGMRPVRFSRETWKMLAIEYGNQRAPRYKNRTLFHFACELSELSTLLHFSIKACMRLGLNPFLRDDNGALAIDKLQKRKVQNAQEVQDVKEAKKLLLCYMFLSPPTLTVMYWHGPLFIARCHTLMLVMKRYIPCANRDLRELMIRYLRHLEAV